MQIRLRTAHRSQLATVKPGQTVLQVLQARRHNVTAPCGGKGTCCKCLVSIEGLGQVLACQTVMEPALWQQAGLAADQPLTIEVPEAVRAQISTDGLLPEIVVAPLICRSQAVLPLSSLADQRADDERFLAVTGQQIPLALLPALNQAMLADERTGSGPDASQGPRLIFDFRTDTQTVVRFVQSDSPDTLGVAVDIGTTTLAAYLYSLQSGERLGALSMLNPQKAYGADVISRIEYASASAAGLDTLRTVIQSAIVDLTEDLVRRAASQTGQPWTLDDVLLFALAGNTTMMHLLAGLPPAAIARAPFIPVSLRGQTIPASSLGLPVHPAACCLLLPSIASYVGADITAGILACDLDRRPKSSPVVLLDIGTNGEIVLAGPLGLSACSTAAGPAFEGANIACGMGAVTGAIDQVRLVDGDLQFTVIHDPDNGTAPGQTPVPRGICGSGLVAAVATLLDAGVIDETGRICDEVEARDLPDSLRCRLVERQGQPAFLFSSPLAAVSAGDGTSQPAVFLTQKDIRELQNAKAAIAAGISLLVLKAGLQPEDVGAAFIAGGFGSYLNVAQALRIGLMPPAFQGRTRSVGNSSGMGASLCLLNDRWRRRAEQVAAKVRYYELSADPRFSDLYIEAMIFPEIED